MSRQSLRTGRAEATFENWKLQPGRTLPGQFIIRIELEPEGDRSYRYQPYLMPVHRKFLRSFAESKLQECMDEVKKHFERQVAEWA